MQIPHILHQIYEDPAGPSELLQRISQSWKENNPDWEYRFWNKTAIDSFLENEFPEFIPIYRAYPYNVQRWDAIRYLILYRIGGLYVDMDYECLEPIDSYLDNKECAMGLEPQAHALCFNRSVLVGNALMATIPNHPYFKALIDDLIANRNKLWSDNRAYQILESTGPFMTTRVYEQFDKKETITLLSDELVAPLTMEEVRQMVADDITQEMEERIEKAFAIHYFLGSWLEQTKES